MGMHLSVDLYFRANVTDDDFYLHYVTKIFNGPKTKPNILRSWFKVTGERATHASLLRDDNRL